jgi:hypothetical protein
VGRYGRKWKLGQVVRKQREREKAVFLHINTSDGIKFTHCERPYVLLTPQLITQTNSKHSTTYPAQSVSNRLWRAVRRSNTFLTAHNNVQGGREKNSSEQ